MSLNKLTCFAIFRNCLCLIFIVGLQSTLCHSEVSDKFTSLKALFNEKLNAGQLSRAQKEKVMLGNYAGAVTKLQRAIQSDGNLQGLIIAKEEVTSANSGVLRIISDSDVLPADISKLRKVAEAEMTKIETQHTRATNFLTGKYVEALQRLKITYTQSGNLDTALAIVSEISKVSVSSDTASARMKQTLSDLPSDLQKDLTVWFPFDSADPDEVEDLSKSQMNGEVSGTEFVTKGKIGGARLFRGTDDRISLASQIPDSKTISISVWVKTSGTVGKGGIFCDYTGKGGNDLSLALLGSHSVFVRADKIEREKRKGADLLDSQAKFPTELSAEWHHLVWVMGARDSIIYLDGERIERISGIASNIGCHGAYIGFGWDGTGWRPFDGQLDEFMMWTRMLSPEEVRRVMGLAAGK